MPYRTPTANSTFFTSALILILTLVQPAILPAQGTVLPLNGDFPLPQSVFLCGEPMPLENRSVREMFDREFTINVWNRAQVFMWLKRAGRYFPFIEKRLAQEGMPDDLKYLAVAESALLTQIRSPAGARGPWQFMTHTARRNGLRRDRAMDERLSFERSTTAALKYLKNLNELFGTWTLAMAAYNCGEARMKRSIKEQKVKDYYRLNLPLETERFIFRIAAIKTIMENPARYGFNLAPDRVYRPIKFDKRQITVRTPINITALAKQLDTDFKVIKELNPRILGSYLLKGRYTINVPLGTGPRLAGVIKRLSRSTRHHAKDEFGRYYIVQPGDTLIQISIRTGVPMASLRRLNGITGSLIRVNQKLRLTP